MHITNLTVEEFKMVSHVMGYIRRHVELSEASGAKIHGIDVLTGEDKIILLEGASVGVEEDTRPLSVGELAYEIPYFSLYMLRDNELIGSRLTYDGRQRLLLYGWGCLKSFH